MSGGARGPAGCRRGVEPVIDWFFRNRRTGRITIAQAPNPALVVFLAAAALRLIARTSGTVGTVGDVGASIALIVWSVDEIVRGVNPWRRILGSGVLAWVVIGVVLS